LDKSIVLNYSAEIQNKQIECLYDFYTYKVKGFKNNLDSVDNIYVSKISQVTKQFIKEHPLKYYFLTPLRFVKSIVLQSNAHNIPFLTDYKNSWVLIFMKIILYIINITSFLSVLVLLFFKKYRFFSIFTLLFTFFTFFYLIYVIRCFEARYIVPLMPFLFICNSIVLYWVYQRILIKMRAQTKID
jgi:hypothetical protein